MMATGGWLEGGKVDRMLLLLGVPLAFVWDDFGVSWGSMMVSGGLQEGSMKAVEGSRRVAGGQQDGYHEGSRRVA
eukprot:748180-Heterocapsa_arctica.AAC.1